MSTQPAKGRQLPAERNTAVARKRLPIFWRLTGSLFLLMAMVFVLGASTTSSSSLAIPVISISSVITDQSVTIQTFNYPPNQTFVVRMHYMGTLGLGGQQVGTLQSGSGGSLSGTYNIPDYLKGQQQVAIRLDSAQGYYSYNWFWNNTSGGTNGGSGGQPPVNPPGGGYAGIPTFRITAVVRDQTVTIQTNNFPANQLFDVTMGPMYAQGFGYKVGEINSGAGGTLQQTFNIPAELQGLSRVSIRAQTRHANPYYAFNWFWNNSADTSGGSGSSGGTGGQPTTPVTGIPTIRICTVSRDQTVTFETRNYPANRDFTVTMGSLATVAGSFNSGTGGTTRQTVSIPAAVQGLNRITIQATSLPFYSYNWFWNNNTTADHCGG